MEKQELNDKLAEYVGQLKVFSYQTDKINEMIERYESLFYNKSIYKQILQKTHVFNGEDRNIDIYPLSKKIGENPLIISFIPKSDFTLLTYNEGEYYNEADKKKGIYIQSQNYKFPFAVCGLLFDPDGEISILVSLKNKYSEILNQVNSNYSTILNIPIVIAGIIKDKENNKEKLEKIVKDNPTSTLANIYYYVKENLDKIYNLGTKLKKFEKDLSDYKEYCSQNGLYNYKNYLLPDEIIINKSNLYYSIKEKAGKIFLEMSFSATNGYYRIEDEGFPLILLFDGTDYKSYFCTHEKFYEKIKKWKNREERETLFTYDTLGLSSPEEKIKEVSQPVEVTACINIDKYTSIENPWKRKLFEDSKTKTTIKLSLEKEEQDKIEKVVSKDLEDNISYVLKSLENFLLTSKIKNNIEKRDKIILEMEELVSNCEQDFNDLANIIANIYKKEIVLTEI